MINWLFNVDAQSSTGVLSGPNTSHQSAVKSDSLTITRCFMSVFLNLLTLTLAFHRINSLFKLVSCFQSQSHIPKQYFQNSCLLPLRIARQCCQTSLSLVRVSKWTFQTSCLHSCLSANSRCSDDPCPLRLVHYRNGQCSSTAGSRLLANVLPQLSSVLPCIKKVSRPVAAV